MCVCAHTFVCVREERQEEKERGCRQRDEFRNTRSLGGGSTSER